jgi:hypothetical protein
MLEEFWSRLISRGPYFSPTFVFFTLKVKNRRVGGKCGFHQSICITLIILNKEFFWYLRIIRCDILFFILTKVEFTQLYTRLIYCPPKCFAPYFYQYFYENTSVCIHWAVPIQIWMLTTRDEFELEFSGSSEPELWMFRAEPSWGTLIFELKPSWQFRQYVPLSSL